MTPLLYPKSLIGIWVLDSLFYTIDLSVIQFNCDDIDIMGCFSVWWEWCLLITLFFTTAIL